MATRAPNLFVKKPSRSDEVIEADQQLKIAEQIRAHFDSTAPKRPNKPNRSESAPLDPTPIDETPSYAQNIPELHKLLALRSQSHPTICLEKEGGSLMQDEFVETQYYKELNSINKQHHTTGDGFIMVEKGRGDGFSFSLQVHHHGRVGEAVGLRSNPATNEWIPCVEGEEAIFISSKPNRSESC